MIVEFRSCRVQLAQGDITRFAADAIVNAANSALGGGGGVDGAIHRAAGPSLMGETRRMYPDGCPTGSAVATSAGRLKARHVFHAVGPVWRGGHHGEPELLASCFRTCLELALAHECQSIAFPAISTGIYGYPLDLAARTSLQAVRDFLLEHGRPAHVLIVLFDAGAFSAFARELETKVE